MVTNKFSSYTDKDLLTIVDGLSNDTLNCTITELKELQAELINRRSDPQQIATVSHLIMKQIATGGRTETCVKQETLTMSAVFPEATKEQQPQKEVTRAFPTVDPKPAVIKPSTAKIDQLRPQPLTKMEIEDDDEKFPVLRFMVLFYKIIGWLSVAAILGGFTMTAIYYLQGSLPAILCGSGISLVVAALILLIFTALSENVLWKLEVEKHLRKDSFR